MYYKMRILPVIFLFSMMTKAQDKVVLGFLIHGVNLILNKGMTGIWIARRYWLFFYIEEPIYPSVYHVFWGGGQDYFLKNSLLIQKFDMLFSKFKQTNFVHKYTAEKIENLYLANKSLLHRIMENK